jgi:hypothetical protein
VFECNHCITQDKGNNNEYSHYNLSHWGETKVGFLVMMSLENYYFALAITGSFR